MTSEEKLSYIERFMNLVDQEPTYRGAIAHASFTRGVLAAYFADQTIALKDYKAITTRLETMMEEKRLIPVIPEKELF